ncbi:unnamed protein product [Citrullus colocynthis]|uniref:Secreted protein n=1 Tax=Citrullus colocynthis TaxID=252529 RepID=A0ABP0Y3T3_9ROSI
MFCNVFLISLLLPDLVRFGVLLKRKHPFALFCCYYQIYIQLDLGSVKIDRNDAENFLPFLQLVLFS